MFVLHIDVQVRSGLESSLERTFVETFWPAISRQEGFSAAHLLRPTNAGDYRLSIAFETQTSQQKWVATALHQEVWPQMEAHSSAYSVSYYNTVG
jgi:heme-degrading monooxygenase HmoA